MSNVKFYEKVPVDSFPLHIVEYLSFPSDFKLHWHEQTEILFLQEGALNIRCGEKIINAKEGDCIIINGNELHEGGYGDCSFICIYLPPALFEEEHYIFSHVVRDDFISDIILKILKKYKDKNHANLLAVKGYAYLLISYLIDNYTESRLTEARYKQRLDTSVKINDAIKYIEQNCFDDITTKELSKISHLSEGYFCHIFKKVTGKSAKEYILVKRIEKAIDMLKNTDLTILEIAMHCGFSDANYFSRVFKKYKKRTPSSYRQLS